MWDIEQGKLMHSIPQTNHQGVCISPDGRWLVHTGPSAHTVWDVGTWALRAKFAQSPAGPTASAAFSPTSDVLALIVDDRSIELVDVAGMRTIAQLESPDSIGQEALTFSADGTKLLVPNARGHTIHMWDLRALRAHLAEMGLDLELPPYPPAPSTPPANPLRVEVDLGELAGPHAESE